MNAFKHRATDSASRWTNRNAAWANRVGPAQANHDTSAETVVWEMEVILASALSLALAVNLALAAFHIG